LAVSLHFDVVAFTTVMCIIGVSTDDGHTECTRVDFRSIIEVGILLLFLESIGVMSRWWRKKSAEEIQIDSGKSVTAK
jgi:hypothetical protein